MILKESFCSGFVEIKEQGPAIADPCVRADWI